MTSSIAKHLQIPWSSWSFCFRLRLLFEAHWPWSPMTILHESMWRTPRELSGVKSRKRAVFEIPLGSVDATSNAGIHRVSGRRLSLLFQRCSLMGTKLTYLAALWICIPFSNIQHPISPQGHELLITSYHYLFIPIDTIKIGGSSPVVDFTTVNSFPILEMDMFVWYPDRSILDPGVDRTSPISQFPIS